MSEVHDPAGLDQALRRAFAPPPLEQLVARVEHAASRPHVPLWPRLLPAACIAAALLVLALIWRGTAPANNAEVARAWGAAYADAARHGFKEPACCSGPIDLSGMCRQLFRCEVELPTTQGVELCGKYASDLACKSTVLLFLCDQMPVCVFVQRLESDPRPDPKALADLRLHRRELPPLVLYELSPAEQPRLLPAFTRR